MRKEFITLDSLILELLIFYGLNNIRNIFISQLKLHLKIIFQVFNKKNKIYFLKTTRPKVLIYNFRTQSTK